MPKSIVPKKVDTFPSACQELEPEHTSSNAEPKETKAGPGHIPANPQPTPKMAAPITSFESISFRVGTCQLSQLNLGFGFGCPSSSLLFLLITDE